jgi:hypothetical protein
VGGRKINKRKKKRKGKVLKKKRKNLAWAAGVTKPLLVVVQDFVGIFRGVTRRKMCWLIACAKEYFFSLVTDQQMK